MDQLTVELLEARHLLSGQSPIPMDDYYEVAAGSTLEAIGGQSVSLTPDQVMWDADDGGNGHVYERVVANLQWDPANVAASQRTLGDTPGHLATITSPAELDFLAANFPDERTWIGAYQDTTAPDYSEPNGGWRWVTGEAWGFTNWNSIEPNNSGSEDYVEWGSGHRWNDLPGWIGIEGYLVEYPVEPILQSQALVAAGSGWKYLDDGSEPGTLWQSVTFDDSNWSIGNAELGYGDGDENTVVQFGADENDKHPTTYFRRSFFANSSNLVESLTLYLKRDDGAVVYLNGSEIVRDGLPGDASSQTFASEAADDGQSFHRFSVDPAFLVNGNNVLAVEVHQESSDSDDLSFDLQLTAVAIGIAGVLDNDTDPEDDNVITFVASGPSNGTLDFGTDGLFNYTPNAGFTGTDQFTYQSDDGTSQSDPATVTINVVFPNAAPVSMSESFDVVQDSILTIDAAAGVLANDTDTDGNVLSAVLVTAPSHGDIVLNNDGSFLYTPNPQVLGDDVFEYVAIDGHLQSETTSVTVTVQSIPNFPTAQSDTYQVFTGETLVVDGPTGGTPSLSVGQHLWAEADGGNGHVYERVVFTGEWILAATAANARSVGGTDGHLVTITSASEDSFVTARLSGIDSWLGGYQDTQAPDYSEPGGGWRWITGETWSYTNWRSGDPNSEGEEFLDTLERWNHEWNDIRGTHPMAAYWVEYPLDAPIRNEVLIPKGDTWQYRDDGSDQGVLWRFPGFDDSTWKSGVAQLGYGEGDEQTTVSYGANANGKHITTYFRREFNATNVGAVERLELLVKRDDGVAVFLNGTEIVRNGLPSDAHYRTVAMAAPDDGQEFYRHSVDPSLLLEGSNVIAVEIHQDSTSSNDLSFDLQFGATFSAYSGLLANDFDPEQDDLAALLITGPVNGTLNLDANGLFTYTPNAGFSGLDQFTYRATDGIFDSAEATVAIHVLERNDPPVAVDDFYETDEDVTLTVASNIGLLSNDFDSSADDLSVILIAPPVHGMLTIDDDGSFTYVPDSQFNGTDQFVYRTSDGKQVSGVATVTITVLGIPDVPIARDDQFTVFEDETLVVENTLQQSIRTVTVNVGAFPRLTYDPIGQMLYVTSKDNNTVTPINPETGEVGDAIIVPGRPDEIAATDNGQYLYVSADGANSVVRIDVATQSIDSTFSLGGYNVRDLHILPGQPEAIAVSRNNPGGIQIYDNGIRRPQGDPRHNQIEVNDDGTKLFGFTSNVSSHDISQFNVSANGLQFVGETSYLVGAGNFEWANDLLFFDSGHIVDAETLTLVGTISRPFAAEVAPLPRANRVAYVSDQTDTIQISDVTTQQHIADIQVPGRPWAHHVISFGDDGIAFVDEEDHVYIVKSDHVSGVTRHDILANDNDPENDPLTLTLVETTQHGTLDLRDDGTFTYEPDPEFSGSDSFKYNVTDGQFVSNTATVTIVVSSVNDAPQANSDLYIIDDDNQPLVVTTVDGVLGNDQDVDGDLITAILVDAPIHGSVDLAPDGSFIYTPGADFELTDSFTYVANDGFTDSPATTVTIDLDVPRIDLGPIYVRPNTPDQQVSIYVHSGVQVSGVNLFLQVGDGGPELSDFGVPAGTDGPAITGVDLKTGTIFESVPDPQIDQPGIPQVATTAIAISAEGQSVLADGLLATVTIDTTGFLEGSWDLLLDDVLPFAALSGPFTTDFAGIPAHITNGQLVIRETEVVGRHLFYADSSFKDAVASDKQPLFTGDTATFANYSSYSRGLNGLFVEVANLLAAPTLDDFEFRVGRNGDLSSWTVAPAPAEFSVEAGAGVDGADRVVIRWPDGAIFNQWLEVTMLPSAETGLATPDVFYYGNAPGDTGDSLSNALVNATDVVMTRDNKKGPFNPPGIDDPYDFNRDGLVNATDVIFARDHITSPFTALQLITPGPIPAAAAGRTPRAPLPKLLPVAEEIEENSVAASVESKILMAADADAEEIIPATRQFDRRELKWIFVRVRRMDIGARDTIRFIELDDVFAELSDRLDGVLEK